MRELLHMGVLFVERMNEEGSGETVAEGRVPSIVEGSRQSDEGKL